MTSSVTIGVLGDYDPTYTTHYATNAALEHVAVQLEIDVAVTWLAPAELERDPSPLEGIDGLIGAPGSPYSRLDGALDALRLVRETGLPALDTCGG